MHASIKGGFWALVLGGAALSVVSYMTAPPAMTNAAQVQAPQVAVPVVIDPKAEPAPFIAANLDMVFEAPVLEPAPKVPGLTQTPLILALHSGAPTAPQVPDAPEVNTQPAAPQGSQIARAPTPAAPAPQQNNAVVTQTARAPESEPGVMIISPTPDAEPQAEAEVAEESPAEENALPEDAPALLRFAVPFENPEGLPVIAVVLIDDGTLTDGPSQMLESGLVATIAVSPLMDDATLWAEAYREAGSEVAMQMPLPDGATPIDAEVSLAAAFEILPEAGLFFSDGEGVLRNDRFVVAQVMQILASEGRGFVTFQRGLGSLVREAERSGVSVQTVLRDIDGAGESNSAIERGLDQAAFRARQLGGVVVVARLKPRTLSVLRQWAFDNQRNGILLGPVSALMIEPPVEEPVAIEGEVIEGEVLEGKTPEGETQEGETQEGETPVEDDATMPAATK
jgi:polysaccharide deacetylase 2 family uncharacterized protein YibQ